MHVRGSTIDRLDICDRIVFDIDPGEDVAWPEVVAAARDVRERLAAIDLELRQAVRRQRPPRRSAGRW